MNKMFNINDEIYTHFKASLVLTGENESEVLNRLLKEYAQQAFIKAAGGNFAPSPTVQPASTPVQPIVAQTPSAPVQSAVSEATPPASSANPTVQKQLFMKWFESLKRNGNSYSPLTIRNYTDRIETICSDPAFSNIPVNNLFSVTNLEEFRKIYYEIEPTAAYDRLNLASGGACRAALRKYDEFLREQSGETLSKSLLYRSSRSNQAHKWSFQEDYICCSEFLQIYAIKKSQQEIESFLSYLNPLVPAISRNSLRMKIQNIKHLATEKGISNTASTKPLWSYSSQNEHAFYQAMADLNLKGNQ